MTSTSMENQTEKLTSKDEIEREIVNQVRAYFSDTAAVVLWGSITHPNFSPNLGDVDTLIVLDKIPTEPSETVREKLYKLAKDFEVRGVDLDPEVTTTDEIRHTGFQLVKIAELHKAHSLVHYQIKYMGKVIFGDEHILDSMPEITLYKALSDILPHVKNNFIDTTRRELEESKNIKDFVGQRKNVFFVLARTLFTIDNQSITTKPEAARYLVLTYPQFQKLGQELENIYKKQPTKLDVEKGEIVAFLDLLERKIGDLDE